MTSPANDRRRRQPVEPNRRSRPINRPDFVETVIERIVPGGHGLAHAGGLTLFVALAAPGERVRARLDRVQGRVAFATTIDVLEPSPDRVAAPCPVYGRCGGCDFQHLSYQAQLAAKLEIVRDCLRRIGGIEPPPDLTIVPSLAPWAYRSRAEWRHDPATGQLGYLARASHRIVDVAACPILEPALERTLARVRIQIRPNRFAHHPRELRAAVGDGEPALSPPLPGEAPRDLVCTIGGETYRYAADCFFQVNRGIVPALVAEVMRHVPRPADGTPRGGLALDLYCGVGLFTLPLARRVARVVGVESFSRAAAYARRNLAAAGLDHATIESARVDAWLTEHAPSIGEVAFALLDPPRTGAEPATVAALSAIHPDRITYVSCDPATLARDLKALLAANRYRLEGIVAFDMFPQTHHVESIAHLVRSD